MSTSISDELEIVHKIMNNMENHPSLIEICKLYKAILMHIELERNDQIVLNTIMFCEEIANAIGEDVHVAPEVLQMILTNKDFITLAEAKKNANLTMLKHWQYLKKQR